MSRWRTLSSRQKHGFVSFSKNSLRENTRNIPSKRAGALEGLNLGVCREVTSLSRLEHLIRVRRRIECEEVMGYDSFWRHRFATRQMELLRNLWSVHLRRWPLTVTAVARY
jgi:hypothetical protein